MALRDYYTAVLVIVATVRRLNVALNISYF